MGFLKIMEKVAPHFEKGGRLEKLYPAFEMVDTFVYTPERVTTVAPHARASIDLKRLLFYVVIGTIPCILWACFNTGYQANLALQSLGITEPDGWRAAILSAIGIGFSPSNPFACFVHGFLYFLPIYIVTVAIGGLIELGFAIMRGHEVNEGFLVTSMLYVLVLPATTPLWMVGLGIAFGVVLGKEVFGGTGKNFLNPALVGRCFLYFAYPAAMSGDTVWVPVDAYSGATALSVAASDGYQMLAQQIELGWLQAFFGLMEGSLGETSAFCCLLGAVFLLWTRIANYRLIVGCLVGMIVTATLFNLIGSDTNPMFAMPWYWHLVLGGFAFGLVFMVTEPVSAAMTNVGRWWYAALIGVMCVLIRVVNPAFPEGMMLAILFGNIFAPLIDHFVVQAHIRARRKRHAG